MCRPRLRRRAQNDAKTAPLPCEEAPTARSPAPPARAHERSECHSVLLAVQEVVKAPVEETKPSEQAPTDVPSTDEPAKDVRLTGNLVKIIVQITTLDPAPLLVTSGWPCPWLEPKHFSTS